MSSTSYNILSQVKQRLPHTEKGSIRKSERERFIELVATVNDGIKSSKHILSDGDVSSYFIDFDLITSSAKNCKIIGDAFIDYINYIKKSSDDFPDFIGFIEKDGIGTTGAIKFAAEISKETSIPNLTVRVWKDIPCERIKVSLADHYNDTVKGRLFNKKVLLVGDVGTSGKEINNAIEDIQNEGGIVHNVVLYYSRLPQEKINEFLNKGINVYSLISPSHARYVAYKENSMLIINRMKPIFDKVDRFHSKPCDSF